MADCPAALPYTPRPSSVSYRDEPWRSVPGDGQGAAALFLSLLKTVLTNGIHYDQAEPYRLANGRRSNGGCDYHESQDCILTWDGWARLTSLEPLVETLLRDGVTGDFAEVGVFRGGVTMYLQGLLLVHNETERRDLWVIDSFQGMGNLSQLRESHNAAGKKLTSYMGRTWANKLAVRDGGEDAAPGSAVQDRFLRHGLLRPNVRIVPGWVEQVLSKVCAPTRPLALLRIDVDLYAPTYQALQGLYPLLQPGGYVLLDDQKIKDAADAVQRFRLENGVTEPLKLLKGTADPLWYWRKARHPKASH